MLHWRHPHTDEHRRATFYTTTHATLHATADATRNSTTYAASHRCHAAALAASHNSTRLNVDSGAQRGVTLVSAHLHAATRTHLVNTTHTVIIDPPDRSHEHRRVAVTHTRRR